MAEDEIVIRYPLEWEEEFKSNGFPPVWLSDFPELFGKARGVHEPHKLPRESMYCFADYALMYLLRKHEGIESTTYYRLAVRNSEAAQSHHPLMST
jgi:hypothetical protein